MNVKDTKADGADFVASKQMSYPSIYDPAMRTLLSIPRREERAPFEVRDVDTPEDLESARRTLGT